ncbi:hypothetical protein XACW160_420026 [Xanthomonas citri pv. citri]|uniref:Uncharacterized protein n=1 Tax=Xanthomonas citri pv. citri TaxID=611301 RepID=A0A0U5FE18_XANCI|nr:hypothetical protein XAC902_530022 [Xanthomonas citri pv. citri]CEE59994.1 hypothetical protein XAC71A_490027 [Xanthomonas citri pv. citri]CEE64288.1 hypothetical protein XACW160_420026 [Xanthomonas citri pv. citri]CEE69565.1 hypothetical protein XAC2852_440026 [Xanthomonas citri pv. citri]CEG16509.1 hypothetical protein XAC3562_420026 [Xanthomonas citri pv. citri]
MRMGGLSVHRWWGTGSSIIRCGDWACAPASPMRGIARPPRSIRIARAPHPTNAMLRRSRQFARQSTTHWRSTEGRALRAADKTIVQPPGGRGRCSESAWTTRTLRFLRAVRTHLATARYGLLAALRRVNRRVGRQISIRRVQPLLACGFRSGFCGDVA